MTAAYIAFVSLVLAARKVSPRGTSLSVSEGSHEGHERILNTCMLSQRLLIPMLFLLVWITWENSIALKQAAIKDAKRA